MLLSKFKIEGQSMSPALKHNQKVFASSIPYVFRNPRVGDIVILLHGRCIIKRIARIKENKVFVVGDNKKQSSDSRNFGWIGKEKIIGKVIFNI
jgi:nickel-type superoxide dismutase maturation protease